MTPEGFIGFTSVWSFKKIFINQIIKAQLNLNRKLVK